MSNTLEEQLYGMFDIPESVKEVKSDDGFYKHPLGVYVGKLGSPELRYIGPDGKKCKADDVGAVPARIILKIYLTKYLGEQDAPQSIRLLGEDLSIPKDRTSFELYYPDTMSLEQRFQWAVIKKFEKFIIPDINDSHIIKENVVRYGKIRLYYGLEVKFILTQNAKGFRYIDEIALTDSARVPINLMKEFEADFAELQKQERLASSNDSANIPQPDASIDDILSGTGGVAPNPAGNDNTLDDDLPF